MLLKLKELQDEQIREALEPKQQEIIVDERDREAALELLKQPRLLDRILRDFALCGVVGEETNKLAGYMRPSHATWKRRWRCWYSPFPPPAKAR